MEAILFMELEYFVLIAASIRPRQRSRGLTALEDPADR